jgi:hypothetical protein
MDSMRWAQIGGSSALDAEHEAPVPCEWPSPSRTLEVGRSVAFRRAQCPSARRETGPPSRPARKR